MENFKADVAFTPAVKAAQKKNGSRAIFQKMVENRDWKNEVNDELRDFLARSNSFYFATATKQGQPYIQHRGGPAGFLKVIDEQTLGFADFSGNRQYISVGNLAENERAHIFLMDYANQRRIKLWGKAQVIENDPVLIGKMTEPGYRARPERAFLFEIVAWDINCPQHIPQKYDFSTVEAATEKLTNRIKELEAEVVRLRATASN